MQGVEDGVVRACCIAVFLPEASYRSVAHRQHVGATITALISRGNRNLRAQVGQGSPLPTLPIVIQSASPPQAIVIRSVAA
jgi:hypothetical protein